MKKKCFAMLMAVAIVVMSIVGCGGSDNKKAAEPDKKTTQRLNCNPRFHTSYLG